ncbi:MAG TPA: hypothetical protein VHZ55_00380 [Bryobacteraceae bacterium]|jgi:hypothetical protein|nr:hypothetical protein [Bryobacteraceae bacterium]
MRNHSSGPPTRSFSRVVARGKSIAENASLSVNLPPQAWACLSGKLDQAQIRYFHFAHPTRITSKMKFKVGSIFPSTFLLDDFHHPELIARRGIHTEDDALKIRKTILELSVRRVREVKNRISYALGIRHRYCRVETAPRFSPANPECAA